MTILPHDVQPRLLHSEDLQSFLFGRECLLEELPFSAEIIERNRKIGAVSLEPGIEIRPASASVFSVKYRFRCRRCGNEHPNFFSAYYCARCRKTCVYCRRCLSMGVVKSCSLLATWIGPAPSAPLFKTKNGRLCQWRGTLSDLQRQAADKLTDAVQHKQSYLVWAVCGAGKTEVLFPAVEKALLAGLRLAVATPRTDVVRELFPRFRKAFPTVPISALYAGSSDRTTLAPVVITTTHQLLRYRGYFDVVIIDEVDAFPFDYDPMLAYAVKKSAKPDTPFIYLSATPPPALKKAFLTGRLQGIKIFRRFHGFPLPVPQSRWMGNWRKKVSQGLIPAPFLNWVMEKAAGNRRLFIFVPSIEMLKQLTPLLQEKCQTTIESVHADDPGRHEKIMLFRQGVIQILVTTTILERGVTVSGVEAAVFGADDPVFDERALVQISGRVGRDPAIPGGEIIFFRYGRTLEMVRAKRHIEQMNREGGFK